MASQYYEGIGRRKAASARVRIIAGTGSFIVNGKPVQEYFTRFGDYKAIMEPLRVAQREGDLDVTVIVSGGGVTGQAGAVRHGLARALLVLDPELRPSMRAGGHLTRDARVKERKKPGLKRARKAPTYTKR